MKQAFTILRMLIVCISIFSFETLTAQTTYYVNDNSTAGDVLTTAVGNNANAGTALAPFATLQYAVNTAAANDIIYVDAGNYSEQVIINKGVTIIGAGQTLTLFTPPASTLVPAPGPFTEIGLFETTQGIGDVHISNLSINSNGNSQNIIIQGGGSVKNCTLLNGQQGIFFRVEPAIKTALIENNTIESGIGINCQGSGLTVTIRNNNISKPGGYYAGIFAGLDFGPLPQLTIQNNIINNYFGEGILAASFNGTYTLNSITTSATNNAINRNGNGGNTPIATCNWFGTSNPATIASKIIGTVIYTPFLTDGTDGSSNVGFQPVGTCGSGNTYYVNDGSVAGDVFTTAVGNNANAGSAAAPFATLQFAVNTAAANDIIYVDAGTYTEQVTITKGITIIGAGQNATSILKPAVVAAPPVGPSSFNDRGVIQTAQNIDDVNIKDLSVTGGLNPDVAPIIIQSGGSVRNCKLQSGNQGLFVRIDAATNPGAKTFYIEGNTIQAEYIAVNTVGTSLHAILSNNTIAAFNAGFSSGMWAGMDFGPLGRLTATNNLFSTYSSSGIQIRASNASITQNAFTGTGAQAINRTGGANITANCNWYGVANAAAIVPKITAGVNYYPWYVDGTDASPAAGFQHYTESCGGGGNIYYVNDNSTSGDIFTTVVGNDANAGTSPTSPLATFGAALTKASPGAVIYMDAGTYTAQDATIDKQVQVVGTNFNVLPNSAADPLLLNSTRNAESIIENTNWIIGANSIYLDGLTFNPLGKQAITLNNTTWSDTRLLRNRLRISSNIIQLNFTGSGTTTMALSAIANWSLNIRENRFEKEDVNFGTTLLVSRYGGVNINNNSFVVTGTAARTQTAINAGSSGVVNYLNIANNTFDRPSVAINSSRLAIANINFNKFINTSNAFFGSNPIPESSEVGIRYNTLDGSGGIFPFIQYQRTGGNAVGASSSFTAEENVITGTAVASTTTFLQSFNILFTNTVLNPSLILRRNKITYSGDLISIQGQNIRPITIRGKLVNATLDNNELTLSGANLQPKNPANLFPDCPAISLYSDIGIGAILPSGSIINILNNKINGFKQSFVVFDVSNAASNGVNDYTGFGNLPAGVTVNINNNSFTGDVMSINNGTVGQSVNASCNWYGSASAQNFINKLSLSTVDIIPWLTNGTDNDVATGFQPVPNSCDGYPTLITLNRSTNVTCNGAANGTINITTSYGKAPFTYTWTKDGDANFVSNSEDLSGLAPGTYRLAIVDGNGSNIYIIDENADGPGTIVVSITEPSVLTASADGTNNACYGQLNGTATVTPGGGTTPYTYLWSNGATASSLSNLAAGIYNVTVTDANGCTASSSYEVTQPTLLTASANGTNVNCFNGTNGSASVTPGGGTAPYTYLWSNGATSSSISSLVAGIYNVTVTDANGCTASSSYEVTQPSILTASANGTNVSCFNGTNGSASITPGGGTAPYTYLWSNGATASSISSLTAGVYNVTVTDANGCTALSSYEVTQPSILTASANGTNVSCFNGSNGSASVTAGGGTAPYTYLWSNGATSSSLSNLAAGLYSVTVTDANGCTKTASYEVTQPTLLTASITNNSTACANIATVTAGGGTPGYTYLWSNGSILPTISGVPVGTYTIAVTDTKGCTATASVTLSVAEAFNPSASVTNVTCFGSNNGIITVTNANGTGQLMFSKDGGVNFVNGSLPFSFTNLAPGNYNIAVKDVNGCTGFVTKTVTQPTQLTPTISSVVSSCFGQSTGAVTVTIAGGTPAYTYSWTRSGGGFSSSQLNISSVAAGNYTLTVTDKNGCTAVLPVTVPSNNEILVNAAITNVLCRNAATGAINLTVTGGTGAGFTYSWTGAVISSNEDLNNISAANNYNVRITDIGSGCFIDRSYQVTQPAALTISTSGTNATGCNSLGTITATAVGGVGNYQYSINGGAYQTSNVFTGLYAGTYTVTVRNGNGCTTNAAARTLTDNGSDQYESNNSRSNSKPISIGTTINARIALATDVADWFVITTPTGGTSSTYNLVITHPTPGINYTFDLYPASPNNAAALIPAGVIGTNRKDYLLAPGTFYRIGVTTTTLSFVCYSLSVNPVIPVTSRNSAASPVVSELPQKVVIEVLKAMTYPNPHRGSFTLSIESPEDGIATVEMYNVNGQLLSERKVNMMKGKGNQVQYNNMNQAILFYRVKIGKHIVNGKIIGPN